MRRMMSDEELQRLLRQLEEPVEPDPEFADQLRGRLWSHVRPPSPWERVLHGLTGSRARWAAIGSSAAAALLLGAVVGLSIDRSAQPLVAGASPTAFPPEVTPSLTPVIIDQPTAQPSATQPVDEPQATAFATPAPQEPVPTATATPYENGWGAAGGGGDLDGGYAITGTWEPLPPMPGPGDAAISHAVLLPDGRVVAFRWTPGWPGDPDVVTLAQGAHHWELVKFAEGEPSISLGSDQLYAVGGDGRLYTHELMLDPRQEHWTVKPFRLVLETDTWAGIPLATGPDGRIYRPADDVWNGTQLVIFDPIADEFSRSSTTPEVGWLVAGRDRLYLFGSRTSSYDPATDTWQIEPSAPPPFDFLPRTAAVGPDERLYFREWDAAAIWAWDAADGSWSTVEPPVTAVDWRPTLATGPDGRIYALHPEGSFAFTPLEGP